MKCCEFTFQRHEKQQGHNRSRNFYGNVEFFDEFDKFHMKSRDNVFNYLFNALVRVLKKAENKLFGL